MITLYDHIQELRAELRCCYFTRAERTAVQAELVMAIAEQAERDRAFDAAPEALSNPPRRSGSPCERPPPLLPRLVTRGQVTGTAERVAVSIMASTIEAQASLYER